MVHTLLIKSLGLCFSASSVFRVALKSIVYFIRVYNCAFNYTQSLCICISKLNSKQIYVVLQLNNILLIHALKNVDGAPGIDHVQVEELNNI